MSSPFILFVEDDPTQATLLALACKSAGIPMSGYAICATGLQAISFLEKAEPPAHQGRWPSRIVTDYRMPLLDGIGFLSWVKGNPRFTDVPVTLMSTSLSDDEQARARLIGADEILTKPALFQELVAVVTRWYSPLSSNLRTAEALALSQPHSFQGSSAS